MTGVGDLEVTGGVGGLEVRADDLELAAAALREVADDLVAVARSVAPAVAGVATAGSALLDPSGAARAAAAVAAVVAGPHGVPASAAVVTGRSAHLLAAAVRYRAADRLAVPLTDARRWLQGSAAVLAAPGLLAVGAAWAVGTAAGGGDPLAEAEQALLEHPGLVDEVVGSTPGALSTAMSAVLGGAVGAADAVVRSRTGRALLPSSLEEAAATLALLYADGAPRVERVGSLPSTPVSDVGGLVRALARADDAATREHQGDIVVTRQATPLPGGGERVAWLVHLPGTKDWQVDPRERRHLNDLATNLELIAGEPGARVDAVRQALDAVGAGQHEPVLLVGHSQGGMLAVRAAAELGDRFRVTHVVTAGSPVGRMPVPEHVSLLSLENRQDVVPRLDAAPNPSATAHVTVLFDVAAPSLVGEHDLRGAYLPAAQSLVGSADPSVRTWAEGAGAFWATPRTTATSTVFSLRNAAPAG